MSSTVHVKSSNGQKYTLEVDLAEMTVGDLKGEMASKVDIPAAQQRLIYRGRVLKDDSTLSTYGVEADHTIHLVRGAPPPGSTPAASTVPPSAAPVPNLGMGGLNLGNAGLGGLGGAAGAGGGADWMGAMGGLGGGLGGMGGFGSGLTLEQAQQEMMRNPEAMRNIMQSPMTQSLLNNPELLRSMFDSNPQLREVMDRNPQLAHVLNDPTMLRESMQAASNPEMMREMMRRNDRAISNLDAQPGGFNALRQHFEDIQDPIMEAMAPPPPPSVTTQGGTPAPRDDNINSAPLPNPWGATGLGGLPFGGGSGGVGSMAPADMAAMMSDPGVQQMWQSMMSNPRMFDSMMASNPAMQAAMQANPGVREALQDPEMRRRMADPAAVQQMIHINGLMAQLQTAVQGLNGTAPGDGAGLGTGLGAGLGTGLGAGLAGLSPPVAVGNPEEAYATQLTQLQDMGFYDREGNIRALQATAGNVNAAVERLLSNL